MPFRISYRSVSVSAFRPISGLRVSRPIRPKKCNRRWIPFAVVPNVNGLRNDATSLNWPRGNKARIFSTDTSNRDNYRNKSRSFDCIVSLLAYTCATRAGALLLFFPRHCISRVVPSRRSCSSACHSSYDSSDIRTISLVAVRSLQINRGFAGRRSPTNDCHRNTFPICRSTIEILSSIHQITIRQSGTNVFRKRASSDSCSASRSPHSRLRKPSYRSFFKLSKLIHRSSNRTELHLFPYRFLLTRACHLPPQLRSSDHRVARILSVTERERERKREREEATFLKEASEKCETRKFVEAGSFQRDYLSLFSIEQSQPFKA